MTNNRNFDAIIIGGSYAGLSAAMALGRALRQVLIIDGGMPCNRQTPQSHNFITQDGQAPAQIAATAKAQVAQYNTVQFYDGLVVKSHKTTTGFEVGTKAGETFSAKKLIFATGLKDTMPNIAGFAECWGISVLHCPYCHGYEVKNTPTGIIVNGEAAFHYAQLISNWTQELKLFTNGKSTLTPEQTEKINKRNIEIIETEIDHLEHTQGQIQQVVFKNQTSIAVNAVYSSPAAVQHTDLPRQMGCELTEQGLLKVDTFQKTNVEGVYACGDNSSFARAVALSVAAGTAAGASLNNELVMQEF